MSQDDDRCITRVKKACIINRFLSWGRWFMQVTPEFEAGYIQALDDAAH
jgi:hypothetical protein